MISALVIGHKTPLSFSKAPKRRSWIEIVGNLEAMSILFEVVLSSFVEVVYIVWFNFMEWILFSRYEESGQYMIRAVCAG